MDHTLVCLFLVIVANGAPVGAWRVLGGRWAWPVDGGLHLHDGRPLLGPSKTVRGVVAAVLATPVCAWLLGVEPGVGVLIAVGAMGGDLLSSFIKRRLGIATSDMALGLDQIPEALVPLLLVREACGLDLPSLAAMVAAFLVIELALSRILYRLRLRKTPY